MRYKIRAKHIGFSFFIEIEYENLPKFCHHCSAIGHDDNNCRRKVVQEKEKQRSKNSKSQTKFLALGKAKGPSVTENVVNQGNIVLLGETNGANNSNIAYKVSVGRDCVVLIRIRSCFGLGRRMTNHTKA